MAEIDIVDTLIRLYEGRYGESNSELLRTTRIRTLSTSSDCLLTRSLTFLNLHAKRFSA